MRSVHATALLVLLGLGTGGCESCSGEEVAELVEVDHRVERDFAATQERWEGAETGATFVIDDGVRTREGSSAVLTLGREGRARLRLEESTAVRFLRRPGDAGTVIDVGMGTAVVEAGEGGYDFMTRFGAAQLEGGAHVRLTAGEDALELTVTMGSAVFDGEERRELGEGDSLSVDFGGAILDPEPEPEPEVAPAPEPDPEPEPEPQPSGDYVVRRLTGRGLSVRAPDGASWDAVEEEPLPVQAGTRLRVPSRATAELTYAGTRTVLRGRGEYVIGENDTLVTATSGGVSIEASERDISIQVPGGTIVARGRPGGSATEIDVRGNRSTLVRSTGGATDIRGHRDTETVQAGESAVLNARGELEVGGRGPERADFVIGAGGSLTVHDPHPPTALGIRFAEQCPGRGVVELIRGGRPRATSAGEGSANLSLPAGGHRYRVRCETGGGLSSEAAATGTVRVVRDSGVSALPPGAPTTFIDTDGRNYRVMYQSNLPVIVVRWPHPPSGGSYVLVVTQTGSAPQTFRSSTPRVELGSGTLRVGSYRMRFRSGAAQSRETSVEVRFDNAMGTATLRSPSEGGFAPGETVNVEGIAVAGWRVFLNGHEAELSSGMRFSAPVVAPTATNGFAIELRHASRGRHFYLRRARAAQP
jgi:hypothetical protein